MRQSRKVSTSLTFRSVVLYLASIVVLFGGSGGLLLGCHLPDDKEIGSVEIEGRTYADLTTMFGGYGGQEFNDASLAVGVVHYTTKWTEWRGGMVAMGEGFDPAKKDLSQNYEAEAVGNLEAL